MPTLRLCSNLSGHSRPPLRARRGSLRFGQANTTKCSRHAAADVVEKPRPRSDPGPVCSCRARRELLLELHVVSLLREELHEIHLRVVEGLGEVYESPAKVILIRSVRVSPPREAHL